jgi:serine/threonine protein kinase
MLTQAPANVVPLRELAMMRANGGAAAGVATATARTGPVRRTALPAMARGDFAQTTQGGRRTFTTIPGPGSAESLRPSAGASSATTAATSKRGTHATAASRGAMEEELERILGGNVAHAVQANDGGDPADDGDLDETAATAGGATEDDETLVRGGSVGSRPSIDEHRSAEPIRTASLEASPEAASASRRRSHDPASPTPVQSQNDADLDAAEPSPIASSASRTARRLGLEDDGDGEVDVVRRVDNSAQRYSRGDESADYGAHDGPADLDRAAMEELAIVFERCIDEARFRVDGSGHEDGVCAVRVANPRHPASSDRAKTSAAVRELFNLLVSRVWFAEEHQTEPSPTQSPSKATDGAAADNGPVFHYPCMGGRAGAVTAQQLYRLLEEWQHAAMPTGDGSVSQRALAIGAPLAAVRRACSARDAEQFAVAAPFDPDVAADEARRGGDGDGDAAAWEVMPIDVIYRPRRTGFRDSKAAELAPGTVLGGQYRVVRILGEATFARAVLCDDLSQPLEPAETGGDVAYSPVCIKVINNSKEFFDQSLDEIRNLRAIADGAERQYTAWLQLVEAQAQEAERNPSSVPSDATLEAARQVTQWQSGVDAYRVISLHKAFYFNEHMCIVCDLLKSNLYEHGRAFRKEGAAPYFTLPRVRSIAQQITKALALTHQLGMVHNDLKPENILFESVSQCLVRVIDFGSSCYVGDKLSSYVQSRSYRAPEVFLGAAYDGKIDVWSLGAILVELLTQDVLFHSTSIPEMLARIVETCGAVPPRLVRRSRHADTLFTRDGVIFAPLSEGDDVRHELYAARSKPFVHVASALHQESLATARRALRDCVTADESVDEVDAAFAVESLMNETNASADVTIDPAAAPERYSATLDTAADGSVVYNDGAGYDDVDPDDDAEDGIYLFMPEHAFGPVTADALGPSWLIVGEALVSARNADARRKHAAAVAGDPESAEASDTIVLPVMTMLPFVEDLVSALAAFDYRGSGADDAVDGPQMNRLPRALSELAGIDWTSAVATAAELRDELSNASDNATVPVSALAGGDLEPLLFLHFVRLCLLLDPEDRPTAKALLQHPFLVLADDGFSC